MQGKTRWAPVALVFLLLALGALFVYLPRIVHPPEGSLPRKVPLNPAGIREVLAAVPDPELGIGIVDLGLVRDIRVERGGKITVTLILTSPFCPLDDLILRDVRQVLARLDGVQEVKVEVDRSVVWTPEMMSREGREKLKGLFE